MDSLLYWLLFNNKRLAMKFLPTGTVSLIQYDKNLIVDCLQTYLRKGSGSMDTLPFKVIGERRATGFFYLIDGHYICPKELANCVGYALTDLINWYVPRFVGIEDRADMLNDAVTLSDSILGANINFGRYNPYELYFNFFSVSFNGKQYPVEQDDFN